ncbi:amidohydrolase family protein [Rhizobium puerariae]|uniref:Amidohydrolase family protein n=1 Tax=Rhizobium puerariae TaxID=1585791 RepID=A0ABV6AMZ9_9HYPH
MRIALTNIERIATGDIERPLAEGGDIVIEDGRIQSVGVPADTADCDVVIAAGGMIAAPGLIDSHVHITFGDYTPRQKTVGFLESYVHGGVTTSISASEVHVPGRPRDPEGVKALAVAAMKCFLDYRPSGMRVHAGSLILEPGLTRADLEQVRALGVWMVKAGFGAFSNANDYAPLVRIARELGMVSMVHTGGSSIPGSGGIWAENLLAINPDVSYHVNGGPTAMPEEGFARLVHESDIALQLCTAGNLRTSLLVTRQLLAKDDLHRLLIATDTPTGSGIMPLGMWYTISYLASLGVLPPELGIAAATGNNARVFGLNSGIIAPGKDADIVLIDACDGGSQTDALSGLLNGDIPAIGAVISGGVPRFVGRSRNTPATMRKVRVVKSTIIQNFSSETH